MPRAFLINRHKIKRDNYRDSGEYFDAPEVATLLTPSATKIKAFFSYSQMEDLKFFNEYSEEIENVNIEQSEIEREKSHEVDIASKCLSSKIIEDDDYLYNLKRLAEITLAYFNNPNVLKNEKSKVYSENHRCWDCGKSYSTSSNLARHRQTHRSMEDKKAKRCEYCGKIYVSIPAYSMHIRTHLQNCKCHICGKCFSRPWLLQGHIRTHTGEKPFKCSVCDKAFADKSNLRAHVQTHSSAKPYVCRRCGKAFTLKSYLYKHEESSCLDVKKEPNNIVSLNNKQETDADPSLQTSTIT